MSDFFNPQGSQTPRDKFENDARERYKRGINQPPMNWGKAALYIGFLFFVMFILSHV